ncbi:MAG: DUF2800 domain-containing protein [Alphaproteobacteria bacterium]|jgi:hypothetical protein|nr:DUF2800 domain-containing protein [Alphaproteobacteria bacterium]
MKHLDIGGSSFDRTFGCPGWLEASKGIAKNPAGPAAIKGSMHHEVQETCRKEDKVPDQLIGLVYKENGVELEFTEDDLDLSEIGYDAVDALLDEHDVDIMEIEPFVQIIPDVAGGSIDLLGVSHDDETMVEIDYKFGRVKVNPKNNKQMLFYLMCARRDPVTADLFEGVKKFIVAIVQPQCKGVTFTWECSLAELDAFEVEAMEKIALAQTEDAPRSPGSWCKYCPAAPYCDAKKFKVDEALLITPTHKKELQAAADIVEEVEEWVNAVKSELYAQVERGAKIKGWKLVEKVGKRAWIDADNAETALKEAGLKMANISTTTLMTAPQIEKVLKKHKDIEFDFDSFVEKKSAGHTLAPEADGRDAITTTGAPENLKKLMAKK